MAIANKKILAAALLVFFVTASMLNGVCICGSVAGADGSGPCIVCVDVCGASSSAFSVQGFDGVADTAPADIAYYPLYSITPPEPGQAVASAEPGETGKPPQS